MKNKTLLWLLIIAIVAIVGLVLMLKSGNTGLGTYDIARNRAIDVLSEERPYVGGNPEGVIVSTGPRQGWQTWQGREPCPVGFRMQTAKITRKENCIPVIQPERYPDMICCPNIRYQ